MSLLQVDTARDELPVIVCIGGDTSSRIALAGRLDGIGVLLMVPDTDTALALLEARAEQGRASPQAVRTPRVAAVDGLVVDRLGHEVTWHGQHVDLSHLERKMLGALAAQPGRIMTYGDLHQQVWGTDDLGDLSSVHSAVKRLRHKLRAAGVLARIESVRGIGFRLCARLLPSSTNVA